ncbi:spore germination protein GerPB [Paenibacillus tuaregi]|uniref:spore germination protein GerPB n=1 Tax=Paenibacillus tuaregi TaxID=1816681 RepID=UPI000838E106|nr:spore germination protein GerPB [Paenibacillus tuaregi]
MSYTVHQTITIHLIRINNMTNSSVLQIGTSGSINAHSQVQNAEPPEPVSEEQPDLEPIPNNKTPSLILLPDPVTGLIQGPAGEMGLSSSAANA